jgi:hypothetical protein
MILDIILVKLQLTLFYTRGLGIVALHVMVPEPYRFPLAIKNRYGNLTIQEFSFKWVKVRLPYKVGESCL